MAVKPAKKKRKRIDGLHAHGCVVCHERYEDACKDLKTNGMCFECRTGRPGWGMLILHRLPVDCCRAHSRLTTEDERYTYRLCGPKEVPWYICRLCARTFPYDNPARDDANVVI